MLFACWYFLSPRPDYTHTQSYKDYKVGVNIGGRYRIALDTDAKEFDGHVRVDPNSEYLTNEEGWDGRRYSLMVYIPCRMALVLYKAD